MALEADPVALCTKLETVRFVTIATRHAGMVHPALDERSVFVVLFLYLPIRVVEIFIEQGNAIVIAHWLAVHVGFVNLAAPRVASCAQLNFPLRLTRRASTRVAGCAIDRPCDAVAFVKRDRQALVGKGLPIALLLRPRHVIGAGTVASLTRDIDLRVRSGKAASGSIVVLAQIGRMTIRTHVVPVLIDSSPMPRVPIGDRFTGIKCEPSLTAARARAAIPGDAECLQSSAGHRDEILLQRIDTERVLDFVIMKRPIGTIGAHHELRATTKESRGDPVVAEARLREVAHDRGICGRLHGKSMMRAVPERILMLVTRCAFGGADEFRVHHQRWGQRNCGKRGPTHPSRQQRNGYDACDRREQERPSEIPELAMGLWLRVGLLRSRRVPSRSNGVGLLVPGLILPSQRSTLAALSRRAFIGIKLGGSNGREPPPDANHQIGFTSALILLVTLSVYATLDLNRPQSGVRRDHRPTCRTCKRADDWSLR
ncbi:MAG TPA: hypothetical protein VNF27_00425 [Candidatus Binataceae bacterium]|nr:hypothetical protein [Candidatus Binataceae bacterium]